MGAASATERYTRLVTIAAAEGVDGKGYRHREEKKDWRKSPTPSWKSQPDSEAPVRAGHRYIVNRPYWITSERWRRGQRLGTVEVESAHRYVIQIGLMIAGAWWKSDNVDNLLALAFFELAEVGEEDRQDTPKGALAIKP